MRIEVEKHRLSAFADGLLGGTGLVLMMWGLNAAVSVYPANISLSVALTLIGALAFATGGFREAYIWGKLSAQQTTPMEKQETLTSTITPQDQPIATQAQPVDETRSESWITEQVTDYPVETQPQTIIPEHEQQS